MVEFGIHLAGPTAEPMGDRHDYFRDLLRLAPDAFTTAWFSDHLMNDDKPMLEGWTTLTYLAAEFPGYRFGNMVLGQGYRNPALVAKMAATLHYLSGGRAILGIGAGWQADEFAAYGYAYPSAGTRIEQLAEALDIIRGLWAGGPVTFEGRHYQVHEAYCEPRPATSIPILVGGRGQKLMRVAAGKADYFNWDGPISRYGPLADFVQSACRELGRDPGELALSASGEVWFPADPAEFASLAPGGMASITAAQDPTGAYADATDWVMGPTPADAIAEIRPLVERGVSLLTVYPHDRRSLEVFAREVVPAFR